MLKPLASWQEYTGTNVFEHCQSQSLWGTIEQYVSKFLIVILLTKSYLTLIFILSVDRTRAQICEFKDAHHSVLYNSDNLKQIQWNLVEEIMV